MNKLLFLFLLSFINIVALAQSYEVPKEYKFEDKEAYDIYEPQVKETIDWLLQASLGKDAIKRQEANNFLMAWISGTPNVSIMLDPNIINFINKNPELLMPFMAGWIKYSLENDYSKDQVSGNIAGIKTIVEFYKKNRGYLKKDANVEKYDKLIEKGKLEEDIRKKLIKTESK